MKFIKKYCDLIISLLVVLCLVCVILISYGYTDISIGIVSINLIIYIFISFIRDIKALNDIAALKDKDDDSEPEASESEGQDEKR